MRRDVEPMAEEIAKNLEGAVCAEAGCMRGWQALKSWRGASAFIWYSCVNRSVGAEVLGPK